MSVDELSDYGMARMDDTEIETFLANQRMGILGLPTAEAPYLLPLSFGYDGDERLYLTFVLGASSRKESLSDQAEYARFLVYKADSAFNWESVLLTGTIDELPEREWDDVEDVLAEAWNPDIFDQAELSRGVTVYAFRIEDRTGIKHTGLPAGFEE